MNSRVFLAVLAVAGVVSLTVVALLVTGLGATFGVEAGVVGEDPKDPELLSFETCAVHCPDDANDRASNSSTSVVAGGANTEVTYARNVSLPDSSSVIGTATFERLNESTYVLSVPFEESDEPARDCAGVVRYNGTVRIPAGDDPWTLLVEHDGERATTLSGDSNSSAFGGSASVSGSVSASEESNATTAEES